MSRPTDEHVAQAKAMNILELAGSWVKLIPWAATDEEYAGPCPRCGGTDCLHVFARTNQWFCRKCTGAEHRGDVIGLYALKRWKTTDLRGHIFSDAVREMLNLPIETSPVREPERRLPLDPERRRELLAQYKIEELAEELHRRMAKEQRQWWENRGISPAGQDYWKLGYQPHKRYRDAKGAYHEAPAYTIPYQSFEKKIVNMQCRMQGVDGKGKYRWYFKGLGSSPFIAYPEMGMTDQVFIAEGAIKGMMMALYITDKWQIVASPAEDDQVGVAKLVEGTGRQWIVPDPGSYAKAVKLAHKIGPTARVLNLCGKIDDLIKLGFTREDLHAHMRDARYPEM